VTPLAPHPHDPGPGTSPGQAGAEFLTTFTITIPDGTPRPAAEGAEAGEAARAHELAGQGHLERLWILPGQGRALGLYRARDSAEMEAIVKSLRLDPWMTTELTPHPSDPATTSTNT
jgi:muconolactone delta-isomerase